MRTLFAAAVLAVAAWLLTGAIARWDWYNGAPSHARAVLLSDATARILSGPMAGIEVEVAGTRMPGGTSPRPGLQLFLRFDEDGRAAIAGQGRDQALIWMLAATAWFTLAVGGRHGPRALLVVCMAIAGPAVIAPLLLRGWSPIIVTGTMSMILLAAMTAVNIPYRRALPAAFGGAVSGLLATTVLAVFMVNRMRLSGVYDWPTRGLWQQTPGHGLDFPGLLVAGLMICALGVVMDLSTAIAGAVHNVAEVDPLQTRSNLYRAGLRVGRDVIGTELNTLIFAFAGANVGYILLPAVGARVTGFEVPWFHAVSLSGAAIGIGETLVATIGLSLTIPLTAAIAAVQAAGKSSIHPPTTPTLQEHTAMVPAGSGAWTPLKCTLALLILAGLWGLASFAKDRADHTYSAQPHLQTSITRTLTSTRAISVNPIDIPLPANQSRPTGESMQEIEVQILSGSRRGEQMTIENPISGHPGNDKRILPGDRVLIENRIRPDGSMQANILEINRVGPLLMLLFLLLAVVLMIGHQSGLRAILALALSAVVVWQAIDLTARHGWPAIPVFLVATIPLCACTFLILAGPTRKALTAGTGTLCAILTGGMAALACAAWMRFSGLHGNELMALRLFATGPASQLDFRGLYVAGVMLAASGVAMDVAMAVASAATEIRQAAPAATSAQIRQHAMRIGRSVIAPMTLTLLCACLGVNLPLLILPWADSGLPPALYVNRDPVATEIVRIAAGNLGVVAAVPFTVWFAGWWITAKKGV